MVNYKEHIPTVVFIALVILSFFIVKPFLTAILLGALLAYMFHPIYTRLLLRIKNKTISALLLCLLVLILLAIPAIFFIDTLIHESYLLFITLKQVLSRGVIPDCSTALCNSINQILAIPEIHTAIQDNARIITDWIIIKGRNLLVGMPQLLLNLFLVLFSFYYFLKQGDIFIESMSNYFLVKKSKYALVLSRLKEIVHGVVFGYLLVALIQGALGALGFFIFGVPSPLFWGLIMALLALIPFLGTGIIWVPASLFIILNGYSMGSEPLIFRGIGLFIYCLIFVASLDNFLKPMLIGDRAKIHPIVIMLGIFGGIVVFGPLGVIIGPLILSLTTVIIDTYIFDEET